MGDASFRAALAGAAVAGAATALLITAAWRQASSSAAAAELGGDGRARAAADDTPRADVGASARASDVRAESTDQSTDEGGSAISTDDSGAPVSVVARERLAALERTSVRYKTLLKVTKAIAAETELKDAIDRIISAATELVHADRVTLFTVNEEAGVLSVGVSKGTARPGHLKLGHVRVPLSKASVAGYCAVTGETVVINDAYSDGRFDSSVDAETGYETRTILCVPLRDQRGTTVACVQAINKREGVVGVVGADSTTGDRGWPVFTDADQQLLESMADFAGGVLHKHRVHEDAMSARRRTESLVNLMRTVSTQTETGAMIEQIIKVSYHLLDAERVTLFLVDARRGELLISESPDAEGLRIPISQGIAGHVAQTGQRVNIADAYKDPRFDQTVDRRTGFRTRSMLCMPVPDAEGKPIAVLQAINKGLGGVFDSTDERILEYMAGHAGIMLRKAQLMEEMRRARREKEALLEVVKLVASEGDITSLVSGVVRATYGLLQPERVSMFLVDPVKQELWMAVSEDAVGTRVKVGVGLAGWVAEHGKLLNIPDAYADPRFNQSVDKETGFRTRSVLCAPVRMGDSAPLAVLTAMNKTEGSGRFDKHDEEALQAFCREVGVALKRKSVETAFSKVIGDGKSAREKEFNVSLLALYSDSTTKARLHTSVLVRGLSIETPPVLPSAASTGAAAAIHSWDLNAFEADEPAMTAMLIAMFDHFQLPRRFKVPAERLHNFISAVRRKYHDNAFHNFYHAFSVAHAAFLLIKTTPAAGLLSYLEVFATLTAALCHDIDHPGHNNAYEVNSESELSLVHNDDAVLERHHAHTTFRVLLDADGANNIFATDALSAKDYKQVRRTVLEAILATDMARHFAMCGHLAERVASRTMPTESSRPQSGRSRSVSMPRAPTSAPPMGTVPRLGHQTSQTRGVAAVKSVYWDKHDDADRLELVRTVVHAADLSGQAYPRSIARIWGGRIIDEFRHQAENEARRGLPVAPFMAGLDDPVQVSKLQLSFIDNVVLPLWESVAELLPGLEEPLRNLYGNRLLHEGELIEHARAAAEKDPASAVSALAAGASASATGAGAGDSESKGSES